ncbi:AAA family ATPase, partial [Psychrobacter celer]|uniref:AAA family ATPase n=1 Tax=Psychrobacter celer TaxID=306572 RepID=UPI003FD0562B
INNSKESPQKFISQSIDNEVLTGIPKHFIDLKELLFTNFKDGERPDFIIKCADELESKLQGKFKAANSDLTFENSKGQSISKSLVSFGMTNLGIFQAVLSKNIINKGSFVFIDEPESNLHPEWQAILANVLVELAKNGVYVIVTTHSSDMLKAFEISTQEQKVSDELSTYYFQTDGTLLAMDDEDLSPIEQARKKLLETYENLMIRGYLL